mmetsp:Transcript_12132/g.28785  ORF Transcript_12132/g.28785 Transcript_12132/m.28785 type:complete len:107 (+) Transcript_12132:660-980(+)
MPHWLFSASVLALGWCWVTPFGLPCRFCRLFKRRSSSNNISISKHNKVPLRRTAQWKKWPPTNSSIAEAFQTYFRLNNRFQVDQANGIYGFNLSLALNPTQPIHYS